MKATSQTQNAPKQQKQPAPVPLTVTLSPAATELVQWYCQLTRHRPEATVDGALHDVLANARRAHEEAPCCDDAFDILLDAVLTSKKERRTERPCSDPACLSLQLDAPASQAVFDHAERTGADKAAVASAAVLAGVSLLAAKTKGRKRLAVARH